MPSVKTRRYQVSLFEFLVWFDLGLNAGFPGHLRNYTIRFSVITQFYLTHRLDPIRCYHSGLEYTWERGQWWVTPHSPKLQHYWSLTTKSFLVISRTHVRGVLLLCRDEVSVFCSPGWLSLLGNVFILFYRHNKLSFIKILSLLTKSFVDVDFQRVQFNLKEKEWGHENCRLNIIKQMI